MRRGKYGHGMLRCLLLEVLIITLYNTTFAVACTSPTITWDTYDATITPFYDSTTQVEI